MRLSNGIKRKVKSATVRILSEGDSGQGVLVKCGNDYYIITAAHCITWDVEAAKDESEPCFALIKTNTKKEIRVQILAAEAVQDVAVLGVLETRSDPDFYNFSLFLKSGVQPLKILKEEPADQISKAAIHGSYTQNEITFPVWILSHREQWIEGHAIQNLSEFYGSQTKVKYTITPNEPIEGGTSGGPVVDRQGRLISIVSQGSDTSRDSENPLPSLFFRLNLALPVWMMSE